VSSAVHQWGEHRAQCRIPCDLSGITNCGCAAKIRIGLHSEKTKTDVCLGVVTFTTDSSSIGCHQNKCCLLSGTLISCLCVTTSPVLSCSPLYVTTSAVIAIRVRVEYFVETSNEKVNVGAFKGEHINEYKLRNRIQSVVTILMRCTIVE